MLEATDARFDPAALEILNDTRKLCPKCERELVLKTAGRGRGAGKQFWGCSGYTFGCDHAALKQPAQGRACRSAIDQRAWVGQPEGVPDGVAVVQFVTMEVRSWSHQDSGPVTARHPPC